MPDTCSTCKGCGEVDDKMGMPWIWVARDEALALEVEEALIKPVPCPRCKLAGLDAQSYAQGLKDGAAAAKLATRLATTGDAGEEHY